MVCKRVSKIVPGGGSAMCCDLSRLSEPWSARLERERDDEAPEWAGARRESTLLLQLAQVLTVLAGTLTRWEERERCPFVQALILEMTVLGTYRRNPSGFSW